MKWISFAIPSYNSEDYLEKCINSLLVGGENVEIIIVNDGSTDRTAEIADTFALHYPTIVKVVHKENGGHGSGINEGIKHATGKYFKVVDSDDWVDSSSLLRFIKTIQQNEQEDKQVDLYITNFIYDKVYNQTRFVRRFNKKFKMDEVSYWNDVKRFRGSEVILMHSLTFRTDILRQHQMDLPKHTFYVDNLYAYQYLPYIKTFYYLDINLYHYFIGREDQSVNIKNFVKRYDQQIRVMTLMAKRYSYDEISAMDKGLRRYMLYCLSSIMIVTIMFTTAECDFNRKKALQDMWKDIKEYDPKLYQKLRFFSYPAIVNWIPFRIKGIIMSLGYKFLQKKVKLG